MGVPSSDSHAAPVRAALVRTVARRIAEDARHFGLTADQDGVLAAIADVPRDRFVPPGCRDRAWFDEALPLAHGQTVSQPSVVALMTLALAVRPGDRVLEIGVGSGYQTAVLIRMGARVYGVEYVPELAAAARARLDALTGPGGSTGAVDIVVGDGAAGRPAAAPFDGILAACAPRRIPDALIAQLRPGRRLVLPVGPAGGPQQLVQLTKRDDGGVVVKPLLPVLFVPMLGGGAGPRR